MPREGITFLRDLKKNNDREWFNPRKHIFEEQVRMPMLEFVRALHGKMIDFAPEFVGEPAKCVYRIYRDTRFSKDKTPYKTWIGALFWRNGQSKNEGPAYYVGISHEGVDIGGGVYEPDPATLLLVRQHVAENYERFRKTFDTPKVRKLYGELNGNPASRIPKGFDPEHPALDLIKCRQYVLFSKLEPAIATTPDLFKETVKRFEAMTPFVRFLQEPFSGRGKNMLL